MTRRQHRLLIAGAVLTGAAIGISLLLLSFRENLVYLYTPADVAAGGAPLKRTFRIGGLVRNGSVIRANDGITVQFAVTDTLHEIPVVYEGILPDLFREGQGVVANGQLRDDGVFEASQVLARHDENYMPPEAAAALEQAGVDWPSNSPSVRDKAPPETQ